VQQQEIGQEERQVGKTVIVAGKGDAREIAADDRLSLREFGTRTQESYADDSQESAVGGTGAPGRDQYLRRLARSQGQNWRSPKLGSGLGESE